MRRLVTWFRNIRNNEEESQKMARLENAEAHLSDLQRRADRAITTLDERHARNHWRESIEKMILGAP